MRRGVSLTRCRCCGSGSPLRLDVRVTPSDEVVALRDELRDLRRELSELRTAYDRLELNFRGECIINLELQDLLREHGISFRGAISGRHGK